MKQLLFLLLFPCLAMAQYQGNGNQKITLGEQTSADGLVYRGLAADTTRKPSVDTMAFILLDTNTNIIWQYKKAVNNAWTRVGGSISSGVTGVLPVANGGTGITTFGAAGNLPFAASTTALKTNNRLYVTESSGAPILFIDAGALRLFNGSQLQFFSAVNYLWAVQVVGSNYLFQSSNTGTFDRDLLVLRGVEAKVGIGYRGTSTDTSNITERLSVRGNLRVTDNIAAGVTSATARLHLAAGTATAGTAPLKFTSGVNLTSPLGGEMEFNGTNLFFSPSTTRHTVNHGLTGSATLNFPSTSTNLSADLTITVTGAADGDVVSLGVPNAAVNANTCYTAWVSAANTVTVRFNNYSSGTVDPVSGTFKVFVTK